MANATTPVIQINEGNVGIGTTTPAQKLHIKGGDIQTQDTTGLKGVLRIRATITGTPSSGGYPFVGTGDAVIEGGGTSQRQPAVITLINGDSSISSGQDLGVIQFVGKGDANNGYCNAQIKCTTQAAAGSNAPGGGILRFYTTSGNSFSQVEERMRINSSGNVGIGATIPDSLLNLEGAKNTSIITLGSTTNDSSWSVGDRVGGIDFYSGDGSGAGSGVKASISYEVEAGGTGSTNSMVFRSAGTGGGTNNAERMRIKGNGVLVKSGNSTTARILPETDTVGYIGESAHRWNAVYAVTGTIQTSDVREKTEIKPTQLGLDFVNDLNPVSYKWIDNERLDAGKDKRNHQGLIAQEVAKTLEKHGVNKNEFGGLDIQKTDKYDDFHGMSYEQLVAPMIKAIQELKAEIEELKKQINK